MTTDENVSFEELCASYEAMDQAEYEQFMAWRTTRAEPAACAARRLPFPDIGPGGQRSAQDALPADTGGAVKATNPQGLRPWGFLSQVTRWKDRPACPAS